MCKCTPENKTPFCGAPGCEWPAQEGVDRATCQHEDFRCSAGIARLTSKDDGPVTGYMAEIRISCARCGMPFQFLGLEPGVDTQGARVSIDGLEANIAITPRGAMPSPLQRMAFNVNKFDG